jgi:hypothetical protein
VISEVFAPEPIASANPLQILIPVAANLWLLGAWVMLLYAAVSDCRLRRRVAAAVRWRDNIFQSEHVASPFVQGVQMIAGEFRKVLEQSGAEVIDAAVGTTFNPMEHEALSMMPHADIAQGCVVNQFRKGWKLGGKIVRPAQVIVSAGAPAPAEPAAEAASQEA